MRIAITGGAGFVGGQLSKSVSDSGHEAVVLAKGADQRPWGMEVLRLPGVRSVRASIDDLPTLIEAFEGCEVVAHCARINREVGRQTYAAVHVQETANVVRAAE